MSTPTKTKPSEQPEPITLEQQQKQSLAEFRSGGHYTININKVDKNARNSADPVYVGVNGVGYAIKRGVNVVVPKAVVEALRNAVETVYEQVGEGRNAQIVATEVPSYGFQILAANHARDASPVPNAVTAGSAARAA